MDFRLAHLIGMLFAMKPGVTSNPSAVNLLRIAARRWFSSVIEMEYEEFSCCPCVERSATPPAIRANRENEKDPVARSCSAIAW